VNLPSFFGRHRARPLARTVTVRDRRGSVTFAYATGRPQDYILTVDIYAYRNHHHPDRHLGWWRFELPPGRGRAELLLDFRTIERESLIVMHERGRISPLDAWCNPAYAFDPLADLQFVIRDAAGEIQRIEAGLLKFVDRDILRSFYARQYATEGYTAAVDAPFLWELHDYKLGRLRRLFSAYIPSGGRVIDVGCGRSLFTEIDERWPFRVFPGDLDYGSVRGRSREVPELAWSVFDAASLPFADTTFDALFAGEVIEHVPDVTATLGEWRRVLKPGGVAIVTTPNRERLLALVDGVERPYSPDHLSELSYRELTRRLLPRAGFTFLTQDCLYLELALRNVLSNRRVEDFLQTEGNRRDQVAAMKRLYPLGRFLPWVSMAMIVVARRTEG
jgi:ubiquinone/menaquinone biosynthesis C-methylase UbiE